MGLKVKGKRGINNFGNEEPKVITNEQPILTLITISTHSLKIHNKNTPQ